MTKLGADPDPFLLHIYAALAEKERALISRRTKDALWAAKARGIVIGGLRDKGRELQAEAFERAEALRPVFAELTSSTGAVCPRPRAALGMRARLFGFGVGWERCREALSCVACGSADDVQHHPLVSGNEEDWNLITLCPRCYDKLLRNGVSNPQPADAERPCSRRSTSAVAGKERHDAELAGDPALTQWPLSSSLASCAGSGARGGDKPKAESGCRPGSRTSWRTIASAVRLISLSRRGSRNAGVELRGLTMKPPPAASSNSFRTNVPRRPCSACAVARRS